MDKPEAAQGFAFDTSDISDIDDVGLLVTEREDRANTSGKGSLPPRPSGHVDDIPESRFEDCSREPDSSGPVSSGPVSGETVGIGEVRRGGGMVGGFEAGQNGQKLVSIDTLNDDKKRRYLRHYINTAGNLTKAAGFAGINRATHYNWLAADPDYADAYAQAQEQAADMIESELRRRAVQGDKQAVRYQGRVVGYERRKSDVLLMFLLKGLRPYKFRDNYNPGINVAAGGNLRISFNIPRPDSAAQVVASGSGSVTAGPDGQVIDVEPEQIGSGTG